MAYQTSVKRDIVFNSGTTFNEGDAIDVKTYINKDGRKNPEFARVHNVTKDIDITFRMERLYVLSDDFTKITPEALEEATCDGRCESMTGTEVEPDGYDEYGLPSILMAVGLI